VVRFPSLLRGYPGRWLQVSPASVVTVVTVSAIGKTFPEKS